MRMKRLHLASTVSLGVLALVGFGGQAQASAIAWSSLQVNNFAVTTTGGTLVPGIVSNTSNASASQTGAGSAADGVTSSTGADVLLQCVGNCTTPVTIGQNQLGLTGSPPPINQVFTRGDSFVAPTLSGINAGAVVESQLVGTIANASASGAAGTTSSFTFTGQTNVSMSFTAILNQLAEVISPGGTAHAFATWTAELDLVNSNGTTTKLATFTPNGAPLTDLVFTTAGTTAGLTSGGVTGDTCSLQSNGLGATAPGQTNTYNCGGTTGAAFGVAIDGLNGTDNYQLVIGQTVSLSASSIPEPKTLGLMAVGLLGVGFFMRRKQRKA